MSDSNGSESHAFALKDCAISSIATGKRAQNLRELRDNLLTIHPGCIFNHFWGGLLRPRFDDPEYNNDFASWARHCLHDARLAERLAVIDPAGFTDMELLRRELVEIIEERLEEREHVAWSAMDQQFHFVRSQIVVFDTGIRIHEPRDLAAAVPRMSLGSVYFHFIDARLRQPLLVDDFRAWLAGCDGDQGELCSRLSDVDPYFTTLSNLRKQLSRVFVEHFGEDRQ